jgi:hypothetical protein
MFTAELQELFLEALRKSPNVSAAARACGVSYRAVYSLRKADPSFAEAWDEAIEQAVDAIEGALYERAIEGVDEPVFHKGEVCGVVTRYSDTAAMFLLKGRRRQVYGDKSQVEMSGPDGGPIQMSDTEKAKRLEHLLQLARERKGIIDG